MFISALLLLTTQTNPDKLMCELAQATVSLFSAIGSFNAVGSLEVCRPLWNPVPLRLLICVEIPALPSVTQPMEVLPDATAADLIYMCLSLMPQVARTPERMAELHRRLGLGRSFGVEDGSILNPEEAASLFPLLDPSKILGALHVPSDGLALAVDVSISEAATVDA